LTGLIGLIERWREKNLSKRAYFLIFVGAFSLASFFMAWRDQFERAESLQAQVNHKQQQPTIQVNVPPPTVIYTPQSASSGPARTTQGNKFNADPTNGTPGDPKKAPKSACDVEGTYYERTVDLPGGPKLVRPVFELEGMYFTFRRWVTDKYWVFMELAITNRGEKSLVKDWELCVDDNGVARELMPSSVPEPVTVPDTKQTVVTNADTLMETAVQNPIDHGQRAVGWVVFSVPESLATKIREDNSRFKGVIRFRDYLSHKYSFFFNANGAQSADVYVPGAK
jgi:hypothetical protein